MLTLSEAVKTGRLQYFIAQEEALGHGPVDRAELDAAIAAMLKAPRSEGRTSRSPLHQDSQFMLDAEDSYGMFLLFIARLCGKST